MTGRVLVAGIGNVFFGDDGFGVEVATRLAAEAPPAGVRVGEYGIRGVHLAYELLEGWDAVVMIDAAPLDEPPGTLAVLRPDRPTARATDGDPGPVIDSHSMNPHVVLDVLDRIGGHVAEVYVVACQPATTAPGMALSPAAAAAVDPAVELVHDLLHRIGSSAERAGPPMSHQPRPRPPTAVAVPKE